MRAACLEADPANLPTVELLDAAGAAYPAVAAGPTSGQEALLGLGRTALWLAYFDNANPTYAINNRLAAIAAVHRLPDRSGLRILELGAGAGSASEALAAELARRRSQPRRGELPHHRAEPLPAPARRAEPAAGASGDRLAGRRARHEPAAGVAGRRGRQLRPRLRGQRAARCPRSRCHARGAAPRPGTGGICWSTAEALRPFAGTPISTELVFRILEDFRDVDLDAERRPNPGFLTAEQWQRLLGDAGFTEVEVVPDHGRIREIYPRFYTGVLVGRR